MNKNEQAKINAQCLEFTRLAQLEHESWHSGYVELFKNKAAIVRTNNYVVLRSLGKVVALFHIRSGTVVDILQYVRGINCTSVRHINKFCELMDVTFGISEVMTYLEVSNNYKEVE